MSNSVKHLIVRVALTLLRTAMKLKLHWVARPFQTVGAFLFRVAFVPAYRVLLMTRRQMSRLYLPAKNRLLFLFSNRFAIHAAIIIVALWSTLLNTQGRSARAEGIGDESVLFILIGGESEGIVEEIAGEAVYVPETVSYREQVALSAPAARSVDWDVISSSQTATTTGLSAPIGASLGTGTSMTARTEAETYIVQEGETIGSIAEDFNLSVTTILWANDLSVRSIIRPGDSLTILPVDGVVHKVKSGDTMSRIASLYDISSDEIATYNSKANVNALSIGEALLIPGGERRAPASRQVASVTSIFTPAPAALNDDAPAVGGMIWPSDLRKVNLYYGVLYYLGRHTGIDIDCNYSSNSNYAAQDGIVTYAGWRRGYGYAVEIDHGNGITTRYGHHAKLYVSSGATVAQGDPIGLCGSTGNSTGAHLHFEVMVNGRYVNPLGYIQ